MAGRSKLLWLGAHYTNYDRDAAVERGFQFISQIASNPRHFREWGSNLLWCFYTISNTAKDQHLREMARRVGQERARQWRLENIEPPGNDPEGLVDFVFGIDAAERLLDLHDEALKRRVQETASHYSAVDFMLFDPRHEPPPTYSVWQKALVRTYTGDDYGVHLGASYRDVLQWIPAMRPYPTSQQLLLNEDKFDDVSYAITHIVYTLNDFGKYRLSPAWLPQEFAYLRTNLSQAVRFNDSETLGEFLDTLRAFGRDEGDPEIRQGMEYLLSHQNPDGSWGSMDNDDIYTRYHSTWTVVDGLREYSFQEEPPTFPEAMHLIPNRASERSSMQPEKN